MKGNLAYNFYYLSTSLFGWIIKVKWRKKNKVFLSPFLKGKVKRNHTF